MFRKAIILVGIFLFTLIIHLNTVVATYSYQKKNAKIAIILDEISLDMQQAEAQVLGASESDKTLTQEIKKDERVAILKAFLRKHDSPLYEHTEFIVDTADKYGIDFRLIPAISMQESGACKVIPYNSYNCWGWGIYGSKVTRFSSYPEAIETVSRGLKMNYIDHGYVTPDEIMRKYNPSSPGGSWARGVNSFFNVLQ